MNIVVKQAVRLVKERWFSVEDAVNLAWDTQTRRGFIKDWKLTKKWVDYGKLSSEQRQKVRKLLERWAEIEDFSFNEKWFIYNKSK